MNTNNNIINRETFEAWLSSLPPEREFNYMQAFPGDKPGCLVCNYLRENTNLKYFIVGGNRIYVGDEPNPLEISPLLRFSASLNKDDRYIIEFENWLNELLKEVSKTLKIINIDNIFLNNIFTAGDIQKRYISLFGNPNPPKTLNQNNNANQNQERQSDLCAVE